MYRHHFRRVWKVWKAWKGWPEHLFVVSRVQAKAVGSAAGMLVPGCRVGRAKLVLVKSSEHPRCPSLWPVPNVSPPPPEVRQHSRSGVKMAARADHGRHRRRRGFPCHRSCRRPSRGPLPIPSNSSWRPVIMSEIPLIHRDVLPRELPQIGAENIQGLVGKSSCCPLVLSWPVDHSDACSSGTRLSKLWWGSLGVRVDPRVNWHLSGLAGASVP